MGYNGVLSLYNMGGISSPSRPANSQGQPVTAHHGFYAFLKTGTALTFIGPRLPPPLK